MIELSIEQSRDKDALMMRCINRKQEQVVSGILPQLASREITRQEERS